MRNMPVFVAILFFALPSSALSKEIVCNFQSWKGAYLNDEDAAISWIGTGFKVDTNKTHIKILSIDAISQGWKKVEKKSTEKFDSYVFYVNTKYEGKSIQNRFSYRVYKNGKCDARNNTRGYTPITATGRWKERR